MRLETTKDYLFYIDEKAEIKEGDIALHNFGMAYELEIPCDKDNLKSNTRFKIIAYRKLNSKAKELNLPLLPPFEDAEIYNQSEDIANLLYNKERYYKYPEIKSLLKIAFQHGYKAAQSKQFSLEDIKKAIEMARSGSNGLISFKDFVKPDYTQEEIIQSLSTQQLPKEFIPEYEDYEVIGERDDDGYPLWSKKLKTITNSEGKQELVGTYKF